MRPLSRWMLALWASLVPGPALAQELPALRLTLALTELTVAHAAAPAAALPTARLAPLQLKSATRLAADADGTAQVLLFQAVALHRQGQLVEAEALYTEVLRRPTPPVEAHLGLARLRARLHGPAAAAWYLESVDSGTGAALLASETGRWWAAAGEHARARAWLMRAEAELAPQDLAPLGALHLLAGAYTQAAAAYRRALDDGQGQPAWWLGLAFALAAIGDEAAARDARTRAHTAVGHAAESSPPFEAVAKEG
ncbi:MAG: hypothetical protein N2Z63_00960 [Thiobacillaceae bacterium]|nr:hypothetical protein [Thiobacillaceae bacterium]